MKAVIITGQLIPLSKNLGTFHFLPQNFQSYTLKSQTTKSTTKFHPLICAASTNGGNENGPSSDEKKRSDQEGKKGESSGLNENERPRLNMKWVDLLVNPDPDNVVAVGLTGVLAWASVQVLWQLFVISTAIVLAALKYSFIAALLVFILITLL